MGPNHRPHCESLTDRPAAELRDGSRPRLVQTRLLQRSSRLERKGSIRLLLPLLILAAGCSFVVASAASLAQAQRPAAAEAESPAARDVASQQAPPAPTISEATLEELVETLESEPARARLVEQLRALLVAQQQQRQAEKAEPSLTSIVVEAVSRGIAAATAEVALLTDELARPGSMMGWLERQVAEPALRTFWIETGLVGLAVGGIGLLVAGLVRWLLSRPHRALEERAPASRWRRLPPLLARTALDLAPIVAFVVAAMITLGVSDPDAVVQRVIVTVIGAIALVRTVAVIARAVLAPLASGLRLMPIADESAAYAYVWVVRLADLVIYGAALVRIAMEAGVSAAGADALGHAVGLIFVLLAFVLLLQSRERVAAVIRGSAETPSNAAGRFMRAIRRVLAETWHVWATLYLVGSFLVWALDVPGGFFFLLRGTLGTLVALVAGALLVRAAGRGVQRLFRVSEPLRLRYPDLERRASRYQPVARGAASTLVWLAAALAALTAWGADALSLLTHESTRLLITGLARIALVLLIGLATWEAAQIVAERLFGEPEGEAGAAGAGRSARVRTLLPLARTALLIVIVAFVSMSVLAELGVNIGPLIAGAGIVGLAIGFGAQTLVKDVITGVFILLEDAISVGDLVEVAGHQGVVEAISIRSIRHRDLSGVLHTIPFSVVDVVRNLSKDYSYYLTDVGVAYRENTDECVEIMREVVEEMRADPEWGHRILEPLDFMGIQSFDDSAVAVRVRIKTLPIEQFRTGREFNRRLKHAFDARGIEIPFPHRTLYFGVDKDGSSPAGRIQLEAAAGEPRSPAPATDESPEDEAARG